MADSPLHLALREMLRFGRSPRLWLTFGAVVALFSVTAPYGTDKIGFLPRLAFWLMLHAASWSVALLFAFSGEILLRHALKSMLIRMLVGSLVAALPIGLVVSLLALAWFDQAITLSGYLREVASALPLCAIFCALSYMAMSGDPGLVAAAVDPPATPSSPEMTDRPREAGQPPLLRRLSPQNRGRLQHISVEDHYSLVRTSVGSELILLRFSDAIQESQPAEGMQVHRSHWVARDFVEKPQSTDGRLCLLLKDGSEIPVSRSYAAKVRSVFGSPR